MNLHIIYAYAVIFSVLLFFLSLLALFVQACLFPHRLPIVGRWLADRQYFEIMGWNEEQIGRYKQDLADAAAGSIYGKSEAVVGGSQIPDYENA